MIRPTLRRGSGRAVEVRSVVAEAPAHTVLDCAGRARGVSIVPPGRVTVAGVTFFNGTAPTGTAVAQVADDHQVDHPYRWSPC